MEGMKRYGWGIVDKVGSDLKLKFRREEKARAEEFVLWNDQEYPADAPHRVVELFYKDEQS